MWFSLSTRHVSVKNPHLFLLVTQSNDYYNTYHLTLPLRKITSLSFLLII